MNKLNDNIKTMLAKELPIIASVSSEGLPNIGPKRSLRAYDDQTLIFNENTGGQTLKNIQAGSKLAIAIIDRAALDGYRFLGTAEVFSEGSTPYQNAIDFANQNGMKPPKFAVLVHINEIYTLRSGPDAGKKL